MLKQLRWWQQWLIVVGMLGVTAGGVCYELLPMGDIVPKSVDTARALLGPEVVGQVESWVFQVQDTVRQARYQATGVHTQVQWAAPVAQLPHQQSRVGLPAPTTSPTQAPLPRAAPTPAPEDAFWSPFVANATGQPILERALVTPDPQRPYVQAALVRIDLHQAQLHLVAGTQEPYTPARVVRPGVIPTSDQRAGRLLAAFNGGFKAVNGEFGMFANGKLLLPPKSGVATLALFRDGSARLGVRGIDMQQTPDMIAFRQNCALLLDNNRLTPQAMSDDPTVWGKTVGNKIATWRSGIGLSADGRYLIYAVGDGLTVPSLAQALSQAGAARAMQLDINSIWTRFVTFAATPQGLAAQKLLDTMQGTTRQFLAADTRDFFYLTTR